MHSCPAPQPALGQPLCSEHFGPADGTLVAVGGQGGVVGLGVGDRGEDLVGATVGQLAEEGTNLEGKSLFQLCLLFTVSCWMQLIRSTS